MTELPTVLQERYRLDEVLRRAPATSTYAGVDLSSGRALVLKELRIADMGEWREYDLFERELQTLSALRHPGIPRLLDHFTQETSAGPRIYLVLERAPGESLEGRLSRGAPTDPAEAQRVLGEVLEILDYLHRLAPPVIHRDVKPSNIVVAPERVSLVDFGGVRRFLPWARDGSTVVGTFGYMAPEQLHGEASPASDLYGLGATTAALLAGCEASRLPRTGLRIDVERIPAARPWREILSRLLEPDPARRFQSASEVLRALKDPAPLAVLTRAPGLPITSRFPEAPVLPRPPEPPATPGLPGFWSVRRFARLALFGFAGLSGLAGLIMEGIHSLFWWPFLGDVAMVLGQIAAGSFLVGLLVRTKPAYIRKLLRLASKRQGRVHLADVTHRLRLPPERARELLEELVRTGIARRDPETEGLYLIGVSD